MNKEIEIPEGYEAKIENNKVIFVPKESEDERIRKEIIDYLNFAESRNLLRAADYEKKKGWIAHLEKQKEQKPVTNGRQPECPYKDLALVKDFFGKYKRKCKLSNKACYSKECEQWNELQAEFKRINEAFENGKNEVINRPEVFGLQKPAEWSEDFEDNIRNLLHDKLTWHSEDGSMSSTVFIDDKTLKDIVSGIWFYVGKEALKYPNKEIHVQEWSEEFLRLMGITISQDGNQVCVLLGENLAEGIAGFGDTLADAVEEFKKEWRQFDRFRKATWKPSKEQIEVFFKANPVNLMPDELAVYHSLCSDLKKL